MTRRSGKTLAMVRSIPDEGATVVVHSSDVMNYVRRMIGDVRGEEVLKRCRIVVMERPEDVDRIRGEKVVAIDHFVIEQASPALRGALREAAVSVRFLCGEV